MTPWRHICISDYAYLPEHLMTGLSEVPYTGSLYFGERPADFDEAQDWEIKCDCDFEIVKRFVHVEEGKR